LPSRPVGFADVVTGEAIAALVKKLGTDPSFGGVGKASWQDATDGELIQGRSPWQRHYQAALQDVLAEVSAMDGSALSQADFAALAAGTQATDGFFAALGEVLGSLDLVESIS
jgi:hypothetical protein